jgi:CarD family transcriptional regulator
MSFKIGDYIVYSGLGIGQIKSMTNKKIGEVTLDFFHVKMRNGASILIPFDILSNKSRTQPVRNLMTEEEVAKCMEILKEETETKNLGSWSKEFRYMNDEVRSGDALKLAGVLRDFDWGKDISYGVKKLRDKCIDDLAYEISLVKEVTYEQIKEEILACL